LKFTRLACRVATLALAGCAAPAWAATTWTADCAAGTISNGVSTVQSGLSASNTLGFTLLGTPLGPGQLTPGPVFGDTIQVNGICTEDVTIRTPGLTLVNHNNSHTVNVSDGVEGQLELAGAGNIVIDGLSLAAPSSFASGESANLYLHDGAALGLKNSQVENGPLIGILVARASEMSVQNTTVSGNGGQAADDSTNMGILATNNATVYLGKEDGTLAATLSGNAGAGIVAAEGSSLAIFGATISGNVLQQVELLDASSGFITGLNSSTTHITALSSGCCQAVLAASSSTLDIEQGAVITGNQNNAAIALDSSTLLLQGSTVTSGLGASSPPAAEPTIHGSGNSVIALAGGNTICFGAVGAGTPCNTTDGGNALGIEHVSTLIQIGGDMLGFALAADNVGGGGQAKLQSTIDMGRGLVSSGPSSVPSLGWITGSAGIVVRQNSSFRLRGGASITGAMTLTQSSNAFFNRSSGGTNSVSGGVLCPFTTIPAAHVAGQTFVSPTPTLASSMLSVAANQCLPF
jgi:hypothetical protein